MHSDTEWPLVFLPKKWTGEGGLDVTVSGSKISFRNDPSQTELSDLLCDFEQVAFLLWGPVALALLVVIREQSDEKWSFLPTPCLCPG